VSPFAAAAQAPESSIDRPLKIAIVTQADPFYIPVFFRRFLDDAPRRGIDTRLVVITSAFAESTVSLARRMWRFYGPVRFVKLAFAYASIAVAERAGGAPRTVEPIARARRVPVRHVSDVNDPAFVGELRSLDLDVILSVAAPQVFKPELLRVPRWGCVNVHAAKLPNYRGMMPNFWAFYHDEPSTGVTVHVMDEAIDHGPILLQGDVPIRRDDTLHALMVRSKIEAARITIDALAGVRDGSVELRQPEGVGSYFSFPRPEHVRSLRQRGRQLL